MSARAGHARVHPSRRRDARPELRVVRRRRGLIQRAASRRYAPAVVATALVAVGLVFAVLLEQVVLAQTAFQVASLTKHLNHAEESHQALLVRWARLQSQDRIARYARDRLGMVAPDPANVRYLVARLPHHGSNDRLAHERGGIGIAAPQESP